MKNDKIENRWRKRNAVKEIKRHDPYLTTLFGGADTGCRKAIVEAGIKKKHKKK